MPEALTHYYFAKDLINTLDDKYKTQANITDPKLFLYSNFFDLGYYYCLSGLFKKDPYELSKRIHINKARYLIENAILFTRENGFDKDNVTMIYAMVSHYVLDYYAHPFINAFSDAKKRGEHEKLKREIDYHMAMEKENLELGKINLAKRFKGAFIFNFEDYALIEHMITKTYFVSRTFEYYHKSLRCYKNFLLHISKDIWWKRIVYSLNDKIINTKSNTLTKNFIYQKKYKYDKDILNKGNEPWFNKRLEKETIQSFLDVYNDALHLGKIYLKAALDYLFLNNKKDFEKLFIHTNIN